MSLENEWSEDTRSFDLEFENGELKAKERKEIPSLVGTRF